MQNYKNYILQLYESAIESLVECDIPREIVDYRYGYKKPRRPTAAFSEFLINRQLGDWTESLFKNEINRQLKGFKALKYGAAGRLIVGDPNFITFFEKYHEELRKIGKRPDLLIFKEETVKSFGLPDDISDMDPSELITVAKSAVAGIEVRSSRYYAAIYKERRGKEQSFTPKLEDIPILTHWVVEHEVPCFYAQIFFDDVHIISFEKILKIIAETGNHFIKRMEKNQRKSTFYIPLSNGILVGKIEEPPHWKPVITKLDDGRVVIYLKPQGGKMTIYPDLLSKYMNLDS